MEIKRVIKISSFFTPIRITSIFNIHTNTFVTKLWAIITIVIWI